MIRVQSLTGPVKSEDRGTVIPHTSGCGVAKLTGSKSLVAAGLMGLGLLLGSASPVGAQPSDVPAVRAVEVNNLAVTPVKIASGLSAPTAVVPATDEQLGCLSPSRRAWYG